MELDVVCGQWPSQKYIDCSRAIGKMSGSTETVLEKCPLEAAVVASLKLIIYTLDFCTLRHGAITEVSPRTRRFVPTGFFNSAFGYMSGRHNTLCKSLYGLHFQPFTFLKGCLESTYFLFFPHMDIWNISGRFYAKNVPTWAQCTEYWFHFSVKYLQKAQK